MPVVMIIFYLQMSCDKGDCVTFFNSIKPGAGGYSMMDSGSLTPKPKLVDPSIDMGNWPKDSAADDLEPTLHEFKMPEKNVDLLNGKN